MTISPVRRPPRDLNGYDPARDADDYYWDPKQAGRVLAFFPRYLRHVQGRNDPFALGHWRDVVVTLHGWRRKDGTRRYREALIAVPRKNGKTMLAAGLALYSLIADNEQGSQVYCAACDRDQATLVFDPAGKMVKANASLSSILRVLDATKRILYPATNSFMRAIPADAAGSHGFNAHCVIIDELHTQPSRELYDVLRTSMAARKQPLLVSITTAGSNRETICHEVWEYARQVRSGIVRDSTFLPVIYEASANDDWSDRKVWKRVNPGLGASISMEYLEETYERAVVTPSLETAFKNLHLNIWTDSSVSWLSSGAWELCQSPESEWPDLTGKDCYVGLDLGSTDDLTAMVYVFPIDGKYYVRTHAWCSAQTVREARKHWQTKYRVWSDLGWLTLTAGKTTDYEEVIKRLLADSSRYNIVAVGYDAYQAKDLVETKLEQQYGFRIVRIPQTTGGLNGGVRGVEIAVSDGLLRHNGSPVLNWCVEGATPYQDSNGNRKLDKKTSSGKIDAAVAMVMSMLLVGSEMSEKPGILVV